MLGLGMCNSVIKQFRCKRMAGMKNCCGRTNDDNPATTL